jgi:N6-adenosine-specific RNA methylase IME4
MSETGAQRDWELPEGKFKTIVADPPWLVGRGPDWGSNEASRPLTYPTMSLEEIAALPVKRLAEDGSHLYLWTINKYLEQAYSVARAWGFSPSTVLVWAKRPHVLTTEFILFCRRGTCKALRRVDSTWWLWKRGKHSQKPEEFQDMIESVSPGPYLELFARRQRPGWTVWGNEVTT